MPSSHSCAKRDQERVLHVRIDTSEGEGCSGDPIADYVAIWMELDAFHQSRRLTEEGWSFLADRLQRPIEMRLLERKPVTVHGALAALELAAYVIDQFEGPDSAGDRAWYRRLRQHMLQAAREFLSTQNDDLSLEPLREASA